jgi:hypothetical protein
MLNACRRFRSPLRMQDFGRWSGSASLGLAAGVPAPSQSRAAVHSISAVTIAGAAISDPSDIRSHVRYASLLDAAGEPVLDADNAILRQNNTAFFVDTPHAGRWHVLDLPMPGAICATVAVSQPVTRVHAFGWIGRDG